MNLPATTMSGTQREPHKRLQRSEGSCHCQVLDVRFGDVYTGGNGGASPASGVVGAAPAAAPPAIAATARSAGATAGDQRASFDSDAAVQVHSCFSIEPLPNISEGRLCHSDQRWGGQMWCVQPGWAVSAPNCMKDHRCTLYACRHCCAGFPDECCLVCRPNCSSRAARTAMWWPQS